MLLRETEETEIFGSPMIPFNVEQEITESTIMLIKNKTKRFNFFINQL